MILPSVFGCWFKSQRSCVDHPTSNFPSSPLLPPVSMLPCCSSNVVILSCGKSCWTGMGFGRDIWITLHFISNSHLPSRSKRWTLRTITLLPAAVEPMPNSWPHLSFGEFIPNLLTLLFHHRAHTLEVFCCPHRFQSSSLILQSRELLQNSLNITSALFSSHSFGIIQLPLLPHLCYCNHLLNLQPAKLLLTSAYPTSQVLARTHASILPLLSRESIELTENLWQPLLLPRQGLARERSEEERAIDPGDLPGSEIWVNPILNGFSPKSN